MSSTRPNEDRDRVKKELGKRAEKLVERELRRRGYRILGRNLRFKTGEVDLLASQGEDLVIVEVRSKTRREPVSPAETLRRQKKRKLLQIAREIISTKRLRNTNVRIDVVEVIHGREGIADEINIIPNAI